MVDDDKNDDDGAGEGESDVDGNGDDKGSNGLFDKEDGLFVDLFLVE